MRSRGLDPVLLLAHELSVLSQRSAIWMIDLLARTVRRRSPWLAANEETDPSTAVVLEVDRKARIMVVLQAAVVPQ